MARVQHPHILAVHDAGTEGDFFYVVMPLATGGSLSDRLDREGALPVAEAVMYTLQVLDGLAAAHALGVVHRDVKPANVLLDHRGQALLADFGIALNSSEHALRCTKVGSAMGSPAYMPPEQRVDARSVDARADIFAVGSMLFELLSASNPADLFTAQTTSPRWDLVPAELVGVLQKATAMHRADRYLGAAEMAEGLLAVAARHSWGLVLQEDTGGHCLLPAGWARSDSSDTIGFASGDLEVSEVGSSPGPRIRGRDLASPLALLSVLGGTGMFITGLVAMGLALAVFSGGGRDGSNVPGEHARRVATSELTPQRLHSPGTHTLAAVTPMGTEDARPAEEVAAPELLAAVSSPAEKQESVPPARRLQPQQTQEASAPAERASNGSYTVSETVTVPMSEEDTLAVAEGSARVPEAPLVSEPAVLSVSAEPSSAEPTAGERSVTGLWTRPGSGGRIRLEVSDARSGIRAVLVEPSGELHFSGTFDQTSGSLTAHESSRRGDESILNVVLSPDGRGLRGTLQTGAGVTRLVSFQQAD